MYWYSTRLQLHAHGNLSLFGESIDIAVIRRNLCPNMENKNLRKKVKIEESDALLFGAVWCVTSGKSNIGGGKEMKFICAVPFLVLGRGWW